MDISSQEALAVLRKWRQEKRLIQCYFRDSRDKHESSCSIVGRIEDLRDDSVTIDCRRFTMIAAKLYGCHVSLSAASGFMLMDSRNIPLQDPARNTVEAAYEMILVIALKSGCFCELRAAKTADELPNTDS